MSSIIKDRMLSLKCRLDAPFPSQLHDSHELIKAWRSRQRLRLLDRPDSVLRDRDSVDTDSDPDLGGDER
jgi:hypothetical protein